MAAPLARQVQPGRSDAGALIFILASGVFLASPLRQIADSKFSTLTSESLIHRGTFTLDHYHLPGLVPVQTYGSASNTSLYQIEQVGTTPEPRKRGRRAESDCRARVSFNRPLP